MACNKGENWGNIYANILMDKHGGSINIPRKFNQGCAELNSSMLKCVLSFS